MDAAHVTGALPKAVFWLYALVIVAGGLTAVLSTVLVRALAGLVVTMFGVAGMYLLMNAPFVALMQLLIYVGAVAVLVFFAIMLAKPESHGPEPERKAVLAILGAVAPAGLLAWAWLSAPPASHGVPPAIAVAELGRGFMEEYLVAFEMISVVLFVAMSAAVLLAFRRRRAAQPPEQDISGQGGER